ncbi:exodeoxyribonuclease VII small subunit [Thiomicrospira cyclica]|jgi:exodeoxyribonuclease VII small subunit|uniref:Exodeoxyribonuclease VII small subunit n=1 Tax=Thiomicrospira cyclica (strain DSM 14477 / JCM 11371 / ALM1) TaxID=717773 RepID=F6DCI0_THICA|nr:exodeoxyribonuclease VII small subunit [Thiomicrospira cyclica]AEG31566.1 Exonuclease VII small subunit [Thiomicrospira cyclica ALM1]
MTTKNNKEAQSFKDNYARLQEIAQQLSQSDAVDIDQLVPMVDEASKAYQLCKSRLDAVEAALSQRIEQEDQGDK